MKTCFRLLPPFFALLVAVAAGRVTVPAQQLAPGFDTGTAAWKPAGGSADWSSEGRTGQHTARTLGTGDDSSWWQTDTPFLEPGQVYRLEFSGRRAPGATGGSAITGPSRANRDFPLTESWETHGFVFRMPEIAEPEVLRLGQWQVRGALLFDEVAVHPALVSHQSLPLPGGVELGEAESIQDGVYRFEPQFGWTGSMAHRPLVLQRAAFNSDRWVFFPGAEVRYRFALPSLPQRSARVRVNLNHHTSGALQIAARRGDGSWTALGRLDGARRTGAFTLPDALFPAEAIELRLLAEADASLQVDGCDYEAVLKDPFPDTIGSTHFLRVLASHPDVNVRWLSPPQLDPRGRVATTLWAENRTEQPLGLGVWVGLREMGRDSFRQLGGLGGDPGRSLGLRPMESESFDIQESAWWAPVGPKQEMEIRLTGGGGAFIGRTELEVGLLDRADYGHRLGGRRGLDVWWCESGWKVGRDRPAPDKNSSATPIRISAARGEYEPFQVVLRPPQNGELRSVRVGPFVNRRKQKAPIQLHVDEVAYVRVTQPTDGSTRRGWYPDPLPPLQLPLGLAANQNQPLWLTVHVPRETPAGDFTSKVELNTSWGKVAFPIGIHVYNFEMPRKTHLRSALGLGSDIINRYHRLERREDQEAVFARYLQNFVEHRISPYSFFDDAPIDVTFAGEGADKRAHVDFRRFDQAAERWLGPDGFTTFQLPILGMGGGTFHSRHLGELAGFQEGTPEHARLFGDYLGQVERHLRERGWLDRAFVYWFDEPDPKDYEFVVAGMKRLKAAAPGLRRMLTEQPEEALFGHVDIWCGLTPEWSREKVQARRRAGEEVWWYICTAPKAPYVTEFIDHPGTELRLWPWQSWQYGVSGLLVWATVYWTSPLVYPEPNVQDPWQDPMSWVTGYGNPVGHKSPWGNGDGRFLYPPRRDPNTASAPCLDGPVDSLRWENLRDGMEDYEYLWLLQQAIERAEGTEAGRRIVGEARALLEVPPEISKDLRHFTTDPRPILAHRERVARMIEALRSEGVNNKGAK